MSIGKNIATHFIAVLLLTTGYAVAQSQSTASTLPKEAAQDKRIIYLSGRVMMDDGTTAGKHVAIERVCNGHPRREAFTDSNGRFNFRIGRDTETLQDASVAGKGFDFGAGPTAAGVNAGLPGGSSGVSASDLLTCEVRASLPGFRSDSIPLAGLQKFDNADVGTIVLHRMGKVEGTRVSVTSLKAPKDAKKAFQRGLDLLQKQKPAEATAELNKAVQLYPEYAEALSRLGDLASSQGRQGEADKLYRQAMAADGNFIPPYFGLVVLSAQKRDFKTMAELSAKALALDPYEFPALYFYDAVANYNLDNMERAEKSARDARRLDSQHRIPKIEFVLANILMQKNDYAGAAEQLRSFLKYSPTGAEADTARQLLSTAESKLAAAPTAPPAPKQP